MAKKKAKKAKKSEAAPVAASVRIIGKNPVMGINGQWVYPGETMECNAATQEQLIRVGVAELVTDEVTADDNGG